MNRDIPIAIAGNKIDLEKDRHVPVAEAVRSLPERTQPVETSPFMPILILSYAKSIGAIHMHTSAKLNKGLDDIFQRLAASMWFFGRTASVSLLHGVWCNFCRMYQRRGFEVWKGWPTFLSDC